MGQEREARKAGRQGRPAPGTFADLAQRYLRDAGRRRRERSVRDDPREVRQHMLRFKREQLEDELARVPETWERILRMSALTRIGAYLAVGVVGVAAVLGLGAPKIVCGVEGAAAAMVAELFRA